MFQFLNSSGVFISRDGSDLCEVKQSLRAELFRVVTSYIWNMYVTYENMGIEAN
jgi:hypothetical protein